MVAIVYDDEMNSWFWNWKSDLKHLIPPQNCCYLRECVVYYVVFLCKHYSRFTALGLMVILLFRIMRKNSSDLLLQLYNKHNKSKKKTKAGGK